MAPPRYWIISLPVQNSHSSLWSRLQEAISKQSFDTPLYRVRKIDDKKTLIAMHFYSISVSDLLLLIRIPWIEAFFCGFLQFNVPDLRVGTLDSLLSLSDDLVKVRSWEMKIRNFFVLFVFFPLFFLSIVVDPLRRELGSYGDKHQRNLWFRR